MLEQSSEPMRTNPKSFVLWFTGLSGVGKSTLTRALYERMQSYNLNAYVLDGDILRTGLNANLGFSLEDRHENLRRAGHVARILCDAGVIVLGAFISPMKEARDMIRDLFPQEQFYEVFVDCPIDVCITRDPKGLYKKAQTGEIPSFTGISSPYEPPLQPDIYIPTHELSIDQSVERLWQFVWARINDSPVPSEK